MSYESDEMRRAREDWEQAMRDQEAAHARGPEVHKLARQMRELNARNHFADLFRAAFGGKRA